MSRFFINRPIVAIVIAIITVVLGLIMLTTLPVAQFPKIDCVWASDDDMALGAEKAIKETGRTSEMWIMPGAMVSLWKGSPTAGGQMRM